MISTPAHRFRFGLRTLFMVVTSVAVVSAGSAIWQRRSTLIQQSNEHLAKAEFWSVIDESGVGRFSQQQTAYRKYHKLMSAKYEQAARYPWLHVEPDPPEPPHPFLK